MFVASAATSSIILLRNNECIVERNSHTSEQDISLQTAHPNRPLPIVFQGLPGVLEKLNTSYYQLYQLYSGIIPVLYHLYQVIFLACGAHIIPKIPTIQDTF